MSEQGRVPKDVKLTHAQQVELAKVIKEKGYTNKQIAYILRLPESIVRGWVEEK